MKKRKLRTWVKVLLIILGAIMLMTSLTHKSTDELGNTCYGTVIRVCGK